MDSLTKCLARNDASAAWLSWWVERLDQKLAIVSFDCDSLRFYQHSLGHHATDNRLYRSPTTLREHFPGCDVVRFAGDEFMVLSPIDLASPEFLADAVRNWRSQTLTGFRRSKTIMVAKMVLAQIERMQRFNITFTVSCCCSPFVAPFDVENMMRIHESNIEKIADMRYANINQFDQSALSPQGRTGVVVLIDDVDLEHVGRTDQRELRHANPNASSSRSVKSSVKPEFVVPPRSGLQKAK